MTDEFPLINPFTAMYAHSSNSGYLKSSSLLGIESLESMQRLSRSVEEIESIGRQPDFQQSEFGLAITPPYFKTEKPDGGSFREKG